VHGRVEDERHTVEPDRAQREQREESAEFRYRLRLDRAAERPALENEPPRTDRVRKT